MCIIQKWEFLTKGVNMANLHALASHNLTIDHYKTTKNFSLFNRLAINHAHPTKLILDLIGFIWTAYFLWENNLMMVIIFGFGFSVLGSFLTLNADTKALAATRFGKYVIARLHPANLSLQLSGYIVSMCGVWTHQGWIILAGLSMVILGHLWGWHRRIIP